MENFYKSFYEELRMELIKEPLSYKSIFRQRISTKKKIIYFYEILIKKLTTIISNKKITPFLLYKNNYVFNNLEHFEMAYHDLNDDYSKKRYLEYIVGSLVHSDTHKLNINISKARNKIMEIDTHRINNTEKEFLNNKGLSVYDLTSLGFDLKIFHNSIGILIDFIDEQYAYNDLFQVEKDDIVIDCGGASGDTALYFASKGAKKVFVYEFIQSNIDIITKQIKLNPIHAQTIEVLSKPVWSESNIELSYLDRGNASKVDAKGIHPNTISTLSIDTMVQDKKLNAIDFIKMDIEGAEIPALEGAKETIMHFKPKLAICVYHKNDDLIKIPKLIKKFNPNYEFYFDYYTDIGWEAVLYAVDKTSK